ncbi:MAG: hypothetical protein ABSH28_17575 [Acidobacteriota bacterium]|jgi:hypothetical protein
MVKLALAMLEDLGHFALPQSEGVRDFVHGPSAVMYVDENPTMKLGPGFQGLYNSMGQQIT